MTAVIDMASKNFGRLTVLARDPRRGGLAHWLCKCACGTEITVSGNNLRGGYSQSCGCTHTKHGHAKTKANTPEYTCWRNMRGRCENPSLRNFKYYGARGIKVCAQWASFDAFLADMGRRPSAKHSIERLNNDGNYEPGNCVWATKGVQNRNRRKLS